MNYCCRSEATVCLVMGITSPPRTLRGLGLLWPCSVPYRSAAAQGLGTVREVIGFDSLTMVEYVRYQDVLRSALHVSLETYSRSLAQHYRAALG
jgi:hypothetical protein